MAQITMVTYSVDVTDPDGVIHSAATTDSFEEAIIALIDNLDTIEVGYSVKLNATLKNYVKLSDILSTNFTTTANKPHRSKLRLVR